MASSLDFLFHRKTDGNFEQAAMSQKVFFAADASLESLKFFRLQTKELK